MREEQDEYTSSHILKFFIGHSANVYQLHIQGCFEEMKFVLYTDQNYEDKWSSFVATTESRFKQLFFDFLLHDMKGEFYLGDTYMEMIENDIAGLTFLEETAFEIYEPQDYSDLQPAVDILRDEIKKGNRAFFKIAQELQSTMEEYVQEKGTVEGKTSLVEFEKKQKKLALLVINMFDLLDNVYNISKQVEGNKWGDSLETTLKKALLLLEKEEIEEISVQGELFDGTVMEGVGTVPLNEVPEGYEKYQVYTVNKRGFRNAVTGEILRKAYVVTVY